MPIRVLLADDHQIVREGLRALLVVQDDLIVVDEVADGRAAVARARELRPDVVVMDASMPLLNGIEACRQIHTELPGVRVLALSMHTERRFIVEMLRAGAHGYLLKDCASDELVRALRTIAAGKTYLSPGISDAVIQDLMERVGQGLSPEVELTGREREVLQLIAEGHSTKVIADQLAISVKTVETHRQSLMRKLQVSGVAELTKVALRMGLTEL
ncbi:MAG: response regulator transcription factor [Pseudomonadota bacterium]